MDIFLTLSNQVNFNIKLVIIKITKAIIAFGDNENDIEMFQLAGTGVAMGNAPKHVQSEADMVTNTNDNDGVYEVLERIFRSMEKKLIY